jgi:hypothetical protein
MALGVLTTAIILCFPGMASASGTLSGLAILTTPDRSTELLSGGSSTPWTLVLPAGATCAAGTTSPSGERVYGFVTTTDPAALTFDANGPVEPATGVTYSLFDTTGTAFSAQPTLPDGEIDQLPAFSWQLFTTVDLPPGSYKVGIACVGMDGSMDRYWLVGRNCDPPLFGGINFTASLSDPNGEAWELFPNPVLNCQPPPIVPETGLAIALPVSALITALAALQLRRLRTNSFWSAKRTRT